MKKEKNHLSIGSIVFLYIGSIMGAGFASGREIWQYFGVFGIDGFKGLTLAAAFFVLLGFMIAYIARREGTADVGKIIMPLHSPVLSEMIGLLLAFLMYTIIISMSAAGGSLLNQEFGLHRAIGGGIITLAVVLTVLGDFERVSRVFSFVIPVLTVIEIVLCAIVLSAGFKQSGTSEHYHISGFAGNWWISSLVYLSYNGIGLIPILGAASRKTADGKKLYGGTLIGGFLLTSICFLLLLALRTDRTYTNALDLPMLGFAGRLSLVAEIVFGVVIFIAIYSAATSLYYGFSTKLPEGKYKKPIIVCGALIGFGIGLTGYRNIVAYMYPFMGYAGMLILLLLALHFIRLLL